MTTHPAPPKIVTAQDYNTYVWNKIHEAEKGASPNHPSNTNGIDYSSVENMKLSEKLNIYKTNYDFDPNKLSPYDAVQVWMYRWSEHAKAVEKNLLDYHGQKELDAMSKEFYEKALAPALKRAGQQPPDEQKWIDNSFEIAKHYHIDEYYNDAFSLGAQKMAYKLGTELMTAGETVTNMLGGIFSGSQPITDKNWKTQQAEMQKNMTSPQSFWSNLQTYSDAHSIIHAAEVRDWMARVHDRLEIMNNLRPTSGFASWAGGMVMGAVPFMLAAPVAAEGATESMGSRMLSNVADLAGGGWRGRLAETFLSQAVTGGVWGTLTRENEDKHNAWQDALQWAAFGTLVHGVFEGIDGIQTRLGRRNVVGNVNANTWSGTRVVYPDDPPQLPPPDDDDGPGGGGGGRALPRTPTRPELPAPAADPYGYEEEPEHVKFPEDPHIIDAWHEMQIEQELASTGRRKLTQHEMGELSMAGASETVAQEGGAALALINDVAAAHLQRMEASGMSPTQIQAYERGLYEHGGQPDRDMLDAVTRIRSMLGARTLTGLSKDDKAKMLAQLQMLHKQATGQMLKYVPNLQNALRRRITSLPTDSIDFSLIQSVLPGIMRQLGPNATKEQIALEVKNHLANAVVQTHLWADDQVTKNPIDEAAKLEVLKRHEVSQNPPPPHLVERTRKSVSSKGEPGVSYSLTPSWKVYAQQALKASGRKWTDAEIEKWVKDLPDDDFAADVHAFFIPKFLKDIQLNFEHGKTRLGNDWSNLYAFALNYKNLMPTQYANRIRAELEGTPRVQKFYNELVSTATNSAQKAAAMDKVVRKLSLGMWNHVDNFLNSGRFPKELNLYRSTNTVFNEPSEHMDALLEERENYEKNLINRVFPPKTVANTVARDALHIVMADRRLAFYRGDQIQFRIGSENVKSELLRPGPKGGKSPAEGKVFSPHGTLVSASGEVFRPSEIIHTEPMSKMLTPPENITKYREFRDKKRDLQIKLDAAQAKTDDAFAAYLALPRSSIRSPEYDAYMKAEAARRKAHDDWMNLVATTPPEHKYANLHDNELYGPGGLVFKDPTRGNRITVFLKNPLADLHFLSRDPLGVAAGNVYFGENISSSMEQAGEIFRQTKDMEKYYPKYMTNSLEELFAKAYEHATDVGIAVVRAGPVEGEGPGKIARTRAEEGTHGWQRFLGQRLSGSMARNAISSFLDPEGYGKAWQFAPDAAKNYVQTNYPKHNVLSQTLEVSAKLICHPPEYFGITEDARADYVWKIYKDLIRIHGSDAFTHLYDAFGTAKALRDMHVKDSGKP